MAGNWLCWSLVPYPLRDDKRARFGSVENFFGERHYAAVIASLHIQVSGSMSPFTWERYSMWSGETRAKAKEDRVGQWGLRGEGGQQDRAAGLGWYPGMEDEV